MSKRIIAASVAAVLACSCGGGGIYDTPGSGGQSPLDTTGASNAATLATPIDAAKAAAALMDFIAMSGGLGVSGSASGSGKSTTTPCDSGSRTFTSNDSTPNTSDGRTVFDQCNEVVTDNGQEVLRQITDGVLVSTCNDSFASDTCQDETDQEGENNVALVFEIITPSSDQRSMALGASRETATGDKAANGGIQYDNRVNHKSATIVYDNMLMFASAASGSRTARIGGNYGLNQMAHDTANCMVGRLTVSTPQDEPLGIDGNDNVTSGHLHFVSSNGDFGDVFFESDRSVVASVNGGAQQAFNVADFKSFCSIQ